MAVKVYGAVTAACPQRVMLCLLEKEVDFEIVNVDFETNQQKSLDHLSRQPFGQVPVVEDGDFRLFESRAIIRYYAAKYADRGADLLGRTLEERALVDQWLEVEAHNFNELIFSLVCNLVLLPKFGKQGDQAVIHASKLKLGKVLDVYEDRLSNSKYLAGEFFTLADLSHLPGIRYLMEMGIQGLIFEREKVSAWWKDISHRPSWNKLMTLL